ncbi:MAG: ESCRT-0 subunit protein hse1 [Bogoriella megaspora]|nr:MAG: ESCRT-0 subunit protein hse1 [Bogoriella megaspora]
MFRAQQNAFDEAVVKATDENLTSENWEFILDVCDRVEGSDTGAKDAVAAMIKRLAHRNANVQLYTLELANSLSQNNGLKIHKELASRSFTDALLRLAGDRNTHTQVKAKILERMEEWTEMFASNPDLGIMEQAYMRLKTQSKIFNPSKQLFGAQSGNTDPNLHPPSKPHKQEITDVDRQKEEEELQMALALSVKDKQGPNASGSKSQAASSNDVRSSSTQSASSAPHLPSGTTAATVSRVRALYDFQPSEPGELQFRKGDVIAVLESVYKDWWKGSLRGQTGIFPLNYVEKLQDPTREELEREAQMEAEVFGEIRNVEKLLALLSTSGGEISSRDNEEITTLYHQTLAIRPKLIELIGKYSQKKDDFTQLNEKFIKARRDYEAMLESSMSQPPPQSQYGRPSHSFAGYPPAQGYSQQGPPPPQQDPQRYYSPTPQEGNYPPQSGPQPFYFIPPGQQAPGAPIQAPPPDHLNPTPAIDPYAPQQQQSHINRRPVSTYTGPQELATTSFDSPQDNRNSYPPAQQSTSSQPQPPYDPYSSGPPPQQQQQSSYPPSSQPPPAGQASQAGISRTSTYDSPSVYSPTPTDDRPSFPPMPQHQAPPVPVGQGQGQVPQTQPPYPGAPPTAQPGLPSQPPHGAPGSPPPQNVYPNLNAGPPAGFPSVPPAGAQSTPYQAYQPPGAGAGAGAGAGQGRWGGGGSGGSGDASDFYR